MDALAAAHGDDEILFEQKLRVEARRLRTDGQHRQIEPLRIELCERTLPNSWSQAQLLLHVSLLPKANLPERSTKRQTKSPETPMRRKPL
jgi:hypothetical protein